MSPLEDPKPGAEASAVRNIALDYLGDIAARLRSFHPEMQGEGSVPSLDEVSVVVGDHADEEDHIFSRRGRG
jgi:cohesin loading factor subunit SCC2